MSPRKNTVIIIFPFFCQMNVSQNICMCGQPAAKEEEKYLSIQKTAARRISFDPLLSCEVVVIRLTAAVVAFEQPSFSLSLGFS